MSSGARPNSPPLEATGEDKPMGSGSVNAVAEGKGEVEAVPDGTGQRKGENIPSRQYVLTLILLMSATDQFESAV